MGICLLFWNREVEWQYIKWDSIIIIIIISFTAVQFFPTQVGLIYFPNNLRYRSQMNEKSDHSLILDFTCNWFPCTMITILCVPFKEVYCIMIGTFIQSHVNFHHFYLYVITRFFPDSLWVGVYCPSRYFYELSQIEKSTRLDFKKCSFEKHMPPKMADAVWKEMEKNVLMYLPPNLLSL